MSFPILVISLSTKTGEVHSPLEVFVMCPDSIVRCYRKQGCNYIVPNLNSNNSVQILMYELKSSAVLSTCSESALESKKEIASTTIQKYWRGHVIRKQFSRPSDSSVSIYQNAIPVGNDPISHLENKVKIHKHPAILATGGAQCLSNAIRLTEVEGKLGKKPKIFLMDYNPKIIRFWKLLSHAFKDSENIDKFLEKLPRHVGYNSDTREYGSYTAKYPIPSDDEGNITKWIPEGGPYENQRSVSKELWPELDVDELHPRQHYEFFEKLFNSDNGRYLWVKNLVINQLCLIQNDWFQSKESFSFIKNVCTHHGYEIFVYSSNIENPTTPLPDVKKLWDNIKLLEPAAVVTTKTKLVDQYSGYPISTEYHLLRLDT